MLNTKPFCFVLFTIFLILVSCSKEGIQELDSPNPAALHFENSEYTINGELFIDGVSQKEQIVDIHVPDISVINGVPSFEDYESALNARYILADQNEESLLAWQEKLGFESLHSEKLRLESLPQEELRSEITRGYNKSLFNYNEKEDWVELKLHNRINSMIMNKHGILRINDHIGTIGHSINLWTSPDNITSLENTILNLRIENPKEFVIVNDDAFNVSKADVRQDSWRCPTRFSLHSRDDSSWGFFNIGRNRIYSDDRSRSMFAYWEFDAFIGISGTGSTQRFNADIDLWINSTSHKKGRSSKYKTNHYLSIDVTVENGLGWTSTRANNEVDSNVKTASIYNRMESFRNITSAELQQRRLTLIEVRPGLTGSFNSGSSVSHRGMAGKYMRAECD